MASGPATLPIGKIGRENSSMLVDQVIFAVTSSCENLTAYPAKDGSALLANHFVAPLVFLDPTVTERTPLPVFRVPSSPVVDSRVSDILRFVH